VIDHGNGWQTWYAHLSQVNVSCGQSVWQGGIIGLGGSTGNSSGPHLHFEVRYEGKPVDPLSMLP
ncbi:MAG: M23 family metallopeptidase, partial [Chloroflexi bacterium]